MLGPPFLFFYSVLSEQPPSSEVASSKRGKSASQQGSAEVTVLHSDKDLIRILAEINFLNSEVPYPPILDAAVLVYR